MAKTSITAKLGLDTTAFQRGLAKSQRGIKNFAKSATASFVRMGAAFAGIGLVKSIVGLGLAAGETASKFNAVFGPAADSMNEKVKELRKTIPATTAEMQNALSTFAAMAKGFGLNTEAANIFSVEMVKIAGDIASFHDLPIEEAFGKIRSAVSGEFEPLKQLGIVINEARLKQEGLNLAIWDGTGQMSAAQKALAVQSIMIRDMGDANGDAAITADSAANKVKFLTKKIKEQGTEIGTTLLPGVSKLTSAFSILVDLADQALSGVGTALGELVYGDAGTQDQEKAKADLAASGITQKSVDHARTFNKLVEDQVKLNKLKDANRKKAAEAEINESKDLTGELEKQIATETDPKRKAALEERLKAYQNLIAAAGKLESQQTAKPGSRAKKPTAGGASQSGGAGRAQEIAKNGEARKPDEGIRFQKFVGPGGESFQQRFFNGKKAGRFTDEQLKQAASGQFGTGSMLDQAAARPGAEGLGENKAEEQTAEQTEYLKSIDDRLSKLDGVLSGD